MLLAASNALNCNSVLPIHSAPLTSISIISATGVGHKICENENPSSSYMSDQTNHIYVATCSVDQRVCLWQLVESKNEPLYKNDTNVPEKRGVTYKLKLFGLTKRFSNVPDI